MIPKGYNRLTGVDFLLAEVSRHAAWEKSIRHGQQTLQHGCGSELSDA